MRMHKRCMKAVYRKINPLVDDKGMVKVRARVNGKGKLFSGMNVRVSVRRSLGSQLVIPKSAVVLRSGKQVVLYTQKWKIDVELCTYGVGKCNTICSLE